MADQEKSSVFSLRKRGKRSDGPRSQKDVQAHLDAKAPVRPPRERSPNTNGSGGDPRSRSKPGAGQNTSEMVKKRYSVRYNQAPDFSAGAPPMPGIPTIPAEFTQEPAQSQGPNIDYDILGDPDLDSEQYVRNFLANATEQDLQDFEKKLKNAKNRASTDLQQNVFRNRTHFIKISKEAEKLKGEMQTLRGLMNDLNTALDQAALSSGQESPTSTTAARKRANRSSVANLEAMWTTQLQALWKNVEGSQKFLPAIPGRHIVHESGNWTELDAATWKARRPVHMVLLNDHFLIATRKRKRVDPNDPNQKITTKLVATECWQLQDIDVMDLSSASNGTRNGGRETKDIANAITIRNGQVSFTYRSERSNSNEKMSLITDFKRTADELRRAEKADLDEASKSSDTMNYLVAKDPAVSRNTNLLRSLSSSKDRPEVLIDVDGKQRNLRWVEGQIDELDIEVALQRFDDAVDRVEQLRRLAKSLRGNTLAQELINIKVDERASKLADIIVARLAATSNFPTATQGHTAHLVRLKYTPLARTAYLSSRTATIRSRARQCVFQGNILEYITELGFIYFTLIKNTVTVYQRCFPTEMMSACVVWAKEMADGFNEGLSRALSGVERGSQVWEEGLARGRQMAELVEEVGLDFRGLVKIN